MSEEIKAMDNVKAEEPENERPHIVTLKRPYKFEGREYTEIDLGGLDSLTIQDAIDAQKDLFGQQEIASALVCETTTAFAMEIAAKASGLPIEFFRMMKRREGKLIQAEVVGHIVRNRSKAGKIMRLEKPYCFRDEIYTEFDLSGVSDMSVMQESAAENAMAMEGFIITETSYNYLYACIIAGMAVNKPKELFTGLPLYELMNLKDSVKDADFFE